MAETRNNSLPDDIRNTLNEAVNSALINAVPYMLAKDLRNDYQGVQFGVLVSTIKELITGDIDNKAAVASKRIPCIILRYEWPGPRLTGQVPTTDVDLRDYTPTSPYYWTEQDVHHLKLRAYFNDVLRHNDRSKVLWYQAPGDRRGYVHEVVGLKPLLRELVTWNTAEELIIQLQGQNKAGQDWYQTTVDTKELPSPEAITKFWKQRARTRDE